MNNELFLHIKKYISNHDKFILGFFPVPIPAIDIEFDYSEKYPKLLDLLNDYSWEFADLCSHAQGWYEFKILEDGNIKVLAKSSEDNSWNYDNQTLFKKELANYGFYKFLNKYYPKKLIQKLIDEDDFPEDEKDFDVCYIDDCFAPFFDVKLEYNLKTGFKEFKLTINGYEIDPDSNLHSFTKRIFRKSISKLELYSNNVDFHIYDENNLIITQYYNIEFIIKMPTKNQSINLD